MNDLRLTSLNQVLGTLLAIGTAVTLAACGGGGEDSESRQQAGSTSTRETSKNVALTLGSTPIPSDANVKGMFGPVTSWPLLPLHAVMLADGRVLSYGTKASGQQTGYFIYDVWDPVAGLGAQSHLTLPNNTGTDLFCAAQVQLPGGEGVIISGGDNWTGFNTTNRGNSDSTYFRLSDTSLSSGSGMALKRWYATATVLLNGEVMIQGGIGDTVDNAPYSEIRSVDGTYRPLTGFTTSNIGWTYPRNFVVSGGRVFGFDTGGTMYYIDPTGNGSITKFPSFSDPKSVGSSAAMYRPGKILQFGGTSANALVIDVSAGGAPVVTPTQPLSAQRYWANATILPDGKVFASGGSRVDNQMTDVVYATEIWDPVTGAWTLGASGVQARLYHSQALLLPDGSVMVGGGGAPGPQNNTNVELYYPPYLFTAGGQLAPRPALTSGPSVADIGSTIQVDVSSGRPISRVTLVKTGAVTHSFNNDQRFIELTYIRTGNRLAIQMPTIASDATPGQYMLFAIDDAGVPSEARLVRVNIAPAMNPAIVPVLMAPGNQASITGSLASLALSATDPNGDALTFTAAGLPTGLTVDPASGVIAGTPTAPGSYSVTVTASDGVNSASRAFTWTITGSVSEVGVGPAPDAPWPSSAAGSVANFSAVGTGLGVEYSWNFGDGSSDTAWSSSGTSSHAYSNPGTYVVNVTARDSVGQTARYTYIQAVYLPATPTAPFASSSIAIEPRTGGNYRVWMVNQDNNSVSVFDGTTRARVAEIAVGNAPRGIALAANGRMWVTNKLSSTVTIIDTNTLAISSSFGLGSGTRPHGIAMSADKLTAFIALEATGRVVKVNTATFGTSASVDVGPNPRHLSLNGAGTQLLVSRFITAQQPGESTTTVTSSVNGVKTGGEVVLINPANMAITKTIVLEHSTQTDTERSARGVPNYLGAAVISPDGTQAWVPSKQDNIMRGTRRDGKVLDFQTTVRAIASRLDLATGAEDALSRQDLDNASLASAGVYDPSGAYLFVALETSREVVVIDVHRRAQLFRIDTGRAPQALAISPDGSTLFVENFMDRTLGAFDLRPLLRQGLQSVPAYDASPAVVTEKLTAAVLTGKQFFYDARDPRLARDGYMSCASCHNDGGSDGRVWDLSSQGEGLRRTISLRGKGKDGGHGFRHWSGNFDEVQDFEGQIRTLAGGTGLMTNAAYTAGTTAQPLGNVKAGVSADLDALAAYVNSLNIYDNSPYYPWGTVPQAVTDGKALFQAQSCVNCHGGTAFTSSGDATLFNIGTLKASSGNRLGGALTGIDPPTLRGLFAQTAFLHDGSAPTIDAAIQAHQGVNLTTGQVANLAAYLRTIGSEEPVAAVPTGTGTGLSGSYFANTALSGTAALTRTELIDLSWAGVGPGGGIAADGWSVRWTGFVETPLNGTYRLQITSDDSVRVWVNGQQIVNSWGSGNGNVSYLSPAINSTAGARLPIVIEHNDLQGDSTVKLRWTTPGSTTYFVIVPVERLYATVVNTPPSVSLSAPSTAVAGTATMITASASDNDGAISKVEFFDNGALVGAATTAPYSLAWTPTAAGTRSLTAVATDNGGATATSATASVNVSLPANVPPTASLTAPATGTVGTAMTLAATATDSDGFVTKVEFFDGTALVATATTAPYGVAWTPATAGNHSLTARATDSAGAMTTSAAVNVNVAAAPPEVGAGLLASYFANPSLSGTAALTRVEPVSFVWSTSLGTQVPAPGLPADNWSARWTGSVQLPGDGTYTLQVVSDDGVRVRVNGLTVVDRWSSEGNTTFTLTPFTGTAGARVAIEIEHYDGSGDSTVKLRWRTPASIYWFDVPASQLFASAPANAAPTASLTAPATGTVGTALTLAATATDSDGSVTKVEFFDGAALVATATTAPYSVAWTPTTAGTHSLTARATDSAGATATSAAVNVSVAAAPPEVGAGLLAGYFANPLLSGTAALTRVEALSFVWSTSLGTQVPVPGLPADNWSARWTGSVQLPSDGTYTLQVVSDDGVRVRVNGVTVVDRWSSEGNTTFTLTPFTGTAGARVAIEIEHYDGSGDSTVKLRWRTPASVYWFDVPVERLFAN